MSKAYDFKEWLRGYPPDRRNDQAIGYLNLCQRYDIGPNGLADPEEGNMAYPYSFSTDWPFPMLFLGEAEWLVAFRSSIHEANSDFSGGSALEVYDVSDYDGDDLASSATGVISGDSGESGIWQWADFGNAWFLTNGSEMVFRYPGVSEGVFVDGDSYANACCASRGRLWLGGLSEMFGTSYVDQLDSYRDYNSSDSLGGGDNWVWYSSVGIEDAFWPHFPWLLSKDGYIDVLERAEFGMMPMRWKGMVLAIKELGEWVIVYGEDGITAIMMKQGVPIRREVANFGITGRGAVAGDEFGHVFVGGGNRIYRLGTELKLEEVGYDGILTDEAHVVAYDSFDKAAYISGANSSYCLTGYGLSRYLKRVSSIVMVEGSRYYSYANCTTIPTSMFETGWLIGETRRPRSVVGVEIDCDNPTALAATVYARQNVADTPWTSTSPRFDSGGYAPLSVSGIDFKVRVANVSGGAVRGLWLHFAEHAKVYLGDLT